MKLDLKLPLLLALVPLCAALSTGVAQTDDPLAAFQAQFEPTVENSGGPPDEAPEGMVWIPGGEFSMGMADPRSLPDGGRESMNDARPIHRVKVDGFWMAKTPVTNAEFARFVEETGYVTIAEQPLDPAEFPGVPEIALVPGSMVFRSPSQMTGNYLQWWHWVPGASWKTEYGPDEENFPVVHIAWEDALAYAEWAGGRLPTEAEWEFAARGGVAGDLYPWGNELKPDGKWQANTWQGRFPTDNVASDGYESAAPVAQFPPNGYGLYDMGGNIWEWCSDWYRPDTYQRQLEAADGGVVSNPKGPANSFDPLEPGIAKRVTRGGSFLCTDQYCTRYMVGSRGKAEPKSSTVHIGFRIVRSPSK